MDHLPVLLPVTDESDRFWWLRFLSLVVVMIASAILFVYGGNQFRAAKWEKNKLTVVTESGEVYRHVHEIGGRGSNVFRQWKGGQWTKITINNIATRVLEGRKATLNGEIE